MNISSLWLIFELILYITLLLWAFCNANNYVSFFLTPLFFSIICLRFRLYKIFFKNELEEFNKAIIFIVIYLGAINCCFATNKIISEAIPQFQLFNSSAKEKDLEKIFTNFNALKYENIPELQDRVCSIDNRFTYILTALVSIEETNKNNKDRTNNLKERRKAYYHNVDKINIRCNNARVEKLLVNTEPINEQNIDLAPMYKRIGIWADEIKRNNAEIPPCNTICAFNHIDQASINIVKELDNIMSKQDFRNSYLTKQEKQYDKLESLQRSKENYLARLNF